MLTGLAEEGYITDRPLFRVFKNSIGITAERREGMIPKSFGALHMILRRFAFALNASVTALRLMRMRSFSSVSTF